MPSLCRAKEGCAAGSARAPTTNCSQTAVDLFTNLPVSRFCISPTNSAPGRVSFDLRRVTMPVSRTQHVAKCGRRVRTLLFQRALIYRLIIVVILRWTVDLYAFVRKEDVEKDSGQFSKERTLSDPEK